MYSQCYIKNFLLKFLPLLERAYKIESHNVVSKGSDTLAMETIYFGRRLHG